MQVNVSKYNQLYFLQEPHLWCFFARPEKIDLRCDGLLFLPYILEKRAPTWNWIIEIHATVEFAQSTLWLQMLADVCNIEVLVSTNVESSSIVVVMIRMEGLSQLPFAIMDIKPSYQLNTSHTSLLKGNSKSMMIYIHR